MGNVLFVYITGGSAGGKGHRSEAGVDRPCGDREISHREICGKFLDGGVRKHLPLVN